MPDFPGMGYPLVPGYESIGRVIDAGASAKARIGERVFVPGSNCYADVRGLFGGAARRLIAPSIRVANIAEGEGEDSVLLALAATAYHALAAKHATPPELIVGHGVLGRLLARVAIACGLPVGPEIIVLVIASIAVVTMVPVPAGNVGLYELAVVGAYQWVGVAPEIALAAALLQHAIALGSVLIPGALIMAFDAGLAGRRAPP